MAKKELKKLNPGQELKLIVDDIGALKDVPALVHKTGDEIISTEEEGNQITFIIKKKWSLEEVSSSELGKI